MIPLTIAHHLLNLIGVCNNMTRKYTNLLIEALDNGIISYESVAKSFLSFLSEDQVKEFVESDFTDLIEEEDQEEDESLSFNTQEEYDDYLAENPPSRSYCLECGNNYEWFMHNCQSNHQYDEMHGCPSCDDQCIFCS